MMERKAAGGRERGAAIKLPFPFDFSFKKRNLGMETVSPNYSFADRIGLLSGDEVQECLIDINKFFMDLKNEGDPQWDGIYGVIEVEDFKDERAIKHLSFHTGSRENAPVFNFDNSTALYVAPEFGIFKRQLKISLNLMFSSRPPYKNTLRAFSNVAPKWFVDKYGRKNMEWEKQ